MNNSTIIRVLETNEHRLVEMMREANPSSREYTDMMENLARGRGLANALQNNPDPFVMPEIPDPAPDARAADPENIEESSEAARETVMPVSEPKADPAAEEEQTPETKAPAVKPCPKPEPQLSKQEMVMQLSFYANKGVDVAAHMGEMGYARLSDIPQSRYQELLEKVKGAV